MIIDNENFEGKMDLDALIQSEDIKNNPTRLARAQRFAEETVEKMSAIKTRIFGSSGPKAFDGSVRNTSFLKGK